VGKVGLSDAELFVEVLLLSLCFAHAQMAEHEQDVAFGPVP